jgi:hypothetical protein
MRPSDPPEYDVLDQAPDEPIVLVGPPDALAGEVRLHNPGEQKLILRDARMQTERPKKAKAGAPPLPDLALRRIVLRRGESRSIPFKVPTSPHTPPGEYRGTFEVGGRTREVVMHVTEMIRLEISPAQILVENWPGETLRKHVVFTNAGNVPLVIGSVGSVVLEDTLLECRTNRAAVAAVGDQIEGLDDYLAELAKQTKAVFEQTGHLRVQLTKGELTLEPGQVGPAELEIRIPDKLDRRSRYLGIAQLYDNNLEFLVVPTHTTPAKRTRKGRS